MVVPALKVVMYILQIINCIKAIDMQNIYIYIYLSLTTQQMFENNGQFSKLYSTHLFPPFSQERS